MGPGKFSALTAASLPTTGTGGMQSCTHSPTSTLAGTRLRAAAHDRRSVEKGFCFCVQVMNTDIEAMPTMDFHAGKAGTVAYASYHVWIPHHSIYSISIYIYISIYLSISIQIER